jgi:tetratricopeptide (TPR) repeat protein
MAKKTVESKPATSDIELLTAQSPQTAEEYYIRGWLHYTRKEYYRAEADLQKALELAPDHAEAMYALGMALSASGRQQEAIRVFEKTITMMEPLKAENRVRAHMVSRLARGHINRIKTGDWHLEG